MTGRPAPARRAGGVDADRDRVIELLRAAVADEQADPGRVRAERLDAARWPPAPSTRWPRSPPI